MLTPGAAPCSSCHHCSPWLLELPLNPICSLSKTVAMLPQVGSSLTCSRVDFFWNL